MIDDTLIKKTVDVKKMKGYQNDSKVFSAPTNPTHHIYKGDSHYKANLKILGSKAGDHINEISNFISKVTVDHWKLELDIHPLKMILKDGETFILNSEDIIQD